MKYGYGYEKSLNAMSSLIGQGDLRKRLINVFCYSLIHITPDRDLPENSRQKFMDLYAKVTEFDQVKDEGQIAASINLMSEEDLNQSAQIIFELYNEVVEAYSKQN